MKFTEHTLEIEQLQPALDRTPGMHFSDVLKRILREQDPGRFKGNPVDPEFVFAGFVWEEVMSAALARMARKKQPNLQQLEIEFRELLLTIDTFDVDAWRVLEFKFTETSSAKPINDHHFWHYLVQLKAYCLATGSDEAELWVYYARGDYRKRRRDAKRFEFEFSKRELEENWRMLAMMRKQMLSEGWPNAR